jgi:Arc/MetJ-type ribon-helix-helix transcriptional regulator
MSPGIPRPLPSRDSPVRRATQTGQATNFEIRVGADDQALFAVLSPAFATVGHSGSRGASQSGTIGGMSTQIAVRLPDELVAYVDQAVAAGRVKSRAELVSRLIARDARRQRAEEDLQRLIDAGALDDADALAMAKATSSTPIED